jgi:hypothetical protein
MYFIFGVLGSDIGLKMAHPDNASVVFRGSADKFRNSTLTEFVVLMEKRGKEKYSRRIKKERRQERIELER